MYRYQHDLFKKEAIYIAGPECFYTYGYDALAAMKARAHALGFGVTLPNDHPLDMENPDKQKRADSIFADLDRVMKETTVIIADLEAYRGAEPDSGSVYELGMAYAKGARCYGYTRDKRSLATKNQQSYLKDGKVYGLIVQNPFGMGYATVVAAARASLNLGNEAVVNTGYTWVTKKNLKTDAVQKILYSK